MGLRLVTDEWLKETENMLESYKIGLSSMTVEHDKALAWAREIRDSKDAVIDGLYKEIEVLKEQHIEDLKKINYLRQAVAWYEARKEGLKK